MPQAQNSSEIAIVGAGPAGLAAAILLGMAERPTVLADRPAPPGVEDLRTSALMQASVQLLRHMGVWPEIAPHAAPLWVMRLIDDTGRKISARDVDFDARELGQEPFGWNIPNSILVAALKKRCGALPSVEVRETAGLAGLDHAGDDIVLRFADPGEAKLRARVVIGSDGRNSVVRSQSGITTRKWRYNQTAVVCTFDHELEHDGISTEFHRPAGPLTLVPLGPKRSSLVWIETPSRAQDLLGFDDAAFRNALVSATHHAFGRITAATKRQAFPITGLTVRRFAKNRAMLVGEAAHVLPPIGAQGLNLGLRDGALAVELIERACAQGNDPGDDAVMNAYDARRRRDVLPRIVAIDLLNRSLMSELLPFQGLRSAGMFALDKIGPLRRAVMSQGIAPSNIELPKVMQQRQA